MRAGVFDSGVGGLTVVKSLLEHQLFSEIIYYGDTARVPYGSKDQNTIIRYSLDALEFFENFNIDIFIVACNTVSAYALSDLRVKTKIPVVGVIESGVLALEKALDKKDSNILIIGTKATIDSNRYVEFLNQKGYTNIISKATSLFVPIVEEGIFSGKVLDETIKFYFQNIKKPDAIILGCTHFPLISNEISKFWNNESLLIHSGNAIVDYLQKEYKLKPQKKETKIKFFASENPKNLRNVAKTWLNR